MRLPLAPLAAFLLSPTALQAQATPLPPAPPSQLTTAKTLFLGVGGSPAAEVRNSDVQVTSWLYTSFHQGLEGAGYTLAPSPQAADLVVEVSIQGSVYVSNGNSFPSNYTHFTIYDPKNHAVLWTVNEPIAQSRKSAAFPGALDDCAKRTAAVLATLASGNLPQK